MQTRRQSIMEAVTNTTIAYCVSLVVQLTVFPLYGIHITLVANLQIVLIFTVISLVRNYIIRRFFNKKHSKAGELRDCLEEAVGIVDSIQAGAYEPDSFTTQPWCAILKETK